MGLAEGVRSLDLAEEVHPLDLAEAAYGWCATIWRSHRNYKDLDSLLALSLEVGFRRIRIRSPGPWTLPVFTRIQNHQEVFDKILKGNDSEAVADLAWASYMVDESGILGLSTCADYLGDPLGGATKPVNQELRDIFLVCVERKGLGALRDVGKEKFVKLLNHLHISVDDTLRYSKSDTWPAILLEIIQSTDGDARNLAIQSWELLVELATLGYLDSTTYERNVTTTLMDGKESDKLECWMVIFWMVWCPEAGDVAEELEDVVKFLEMKRPGALRERMEQWNKRRFKSFPKAFQQTYDKLAL